MQAKPLSKDGSVHVTDERVNTISHLGASCSALAGGALLVAQANGQGEPWKIVAFSIYGLCVLSAARALPQHLRMDGAGRLFISLGWLTVLLVGAGVSLPVGALVLMAAGGIVYSAGFVIYVVEKPNLLPGVFGFHELWHVLVVLAALLHYLLMYFYVLPA